jgi:hypothetical protein
MAQPSPISVTTLNSFFKIQYAKKIARVVPNSAIIWRETGMGDVERVGSKLITPVLLSQEQGLSFDVASGTATTNAAISMQISDATVNPPQMSIKSQLPIDTILRAQRDQDAFERATDIRFKEQKNSLLRNWEWSALYGTEAVFTINGAPTGTTPRVLTASNHSPGFLATLLNANLDAFNGTTKINTNAPLNVSAISISAAGTSTVSVTGNSTDLANLATTYTLYRVGANLGAGNFAECVGLLPAIANTGVLYGIDASANPGWKGNVLSTVGALTLAKLCDGVATAQVFGCDEDLKVLVSPRNYSRLLQEQNLLVRYGGKGGGAGGDVKQGFKSYEVEQGGVSFTLVSHPFLKDSDYAVLPMDEVKKVGTSDDVVTNVAGMDAIVFDHTTNSYYMTMYVSMLPFLQRPSWSVRGTGVTIP